MQGLRLALVSEKALLCEYDDLNSDNGILLNFLRNKQVEASVQVWDDERVDWTQFDLIIMKTPWDYVQKIDTFNSWLDKLEHLNVRVLNPIKTIRWNSNKIYLQELQRNKVTIVPTIWFEKTDSLDLANIFDHFNAERIIIKPWISSTARHTYLLTREEATSKTDELKELLKVEALMAQPFLKEVQSVGEYSVLFFNGKYSHTVLKTPKKGDFRVQYDYGGIINQVEPPKKLLASAQAIVDKFAKGCLYTRVDGLNVNDEFTLMEFELIEPNLFLDKSEGSYERYYEAIHALLQKE